MQPDKTKTSNPNAQLIKRRFPTGPCILRFQAQRRDGTPGGVIDALVLTVADTSSAPINGRPTGQVKAYYIDPTLGNEPRALIRNLATENGIDPNAYDATTFNVLKEAEILPLPHAGQIKAEVERIVNVVREGLIDRTADMAAQVSALDARVVGAMARIDAMPGSAEVNGLRLDLAAVRNLAEGAMVSAENLLAEERIQFAADRAALEERLEGMSVKLREMDRLYQEMRRDIQVLLANDIHDARTAHADDAPLPAISSPLIPAAAPQDPMLLAYIDSLKGLNFAQMKKEYSAVTGEELGRGNPKNWSMAQYRQHLIDHRARQLLSQQADSAA